MTKNHAKHAKTATKQAVAAQIDKISKKAAKSASKSKGDRAWCFTINNPLPEDIASIPLITSAKYVVYGQETGTECGTLHLQGFIYFTDCKTLSAVKKILPRAHLSVKSGFSKFSEAIGYCKKGACTDANKPSDIEGGWGKFSIVQHPTYRGYEAGTAPMDPSDKGAAEQERFQTAWQLAKEGKIEEVDADIRLRYLSTLEKVSRQYASPPDTLCGLLSHEWHYGPAGSGKSCAIREMYPSDVLYVKGVHKWWDRYNGQPYVLIDEWPVDATKELQGLLKNWSDRYPFDAEVKGGSCFIRPTRILVTSNYSLEECFHHDRKGLLEPLQRRFTEVQYEGRFDWDKAQSDSTLI